MEFKDVPEGATHWRESPLTRKTLYYKADGSGWSVHRGPGGWCKSTINPAQVKATLKPLPELAKVEVTAGTEIPPGATHRHVLVDAPKYEGLFYRKTAGAWEFFSLSEGWQPSNNRAGWHNRLTPLAGAPAAKPEPAQAPPSPVTAADAKGIPDFQPPTEAPAWMNEKHAAPTPPGLVTVKPIWRP